MCAQLVEQWRTNGVLGPDGRVLGAFEEPYVSAFVPQSVWIVTDSHVIVAQSLLRRRPSWTHYPLVAARFNRSEYTVHISAEGVRAKGSGRGRFAGQSITLGQSTGMTFDPTRDTVALGKASELEQLLLSAQWEAKNRTEPHGRQSPMSPFLGPQQPEQTDRVIAELEHVLSARPDRTTPASAEFVQATFDAVDSAWYDLAGLGNLPLTWVARCFMTDLGSRSKNEAFLDSLGIHKYLGRDLDWFVSFARANHKLGAPDHAWITACESLGSDKANGLLLATFWVGAGTLAVSSGRSFRCSPRISRRRQRIALLVSPSPAWRAATRPNASVAVSEGVPLSDIRGAGRRRPEMSASAPTPAVRDRPRSRSDGASGPTVRVRSRRSLHFDAGYVVGPASVRSVSSPYPIERTSTGTGSRSLCSPRPNDDPRVMRRRNQHRGVAISRRRVAQRKHRFPRPGRCRSLPS